MRKQLAIEWTKEGVTIGQGKTALKLAFAPASIEEIEDFSRRVDVARRVQAGLHGAYLKFRSGRGDYADGCRNYEDLIVSLDAAQEKVLTALRDVSAFFNPPNLIERLNEAGFTPEDLDAFVMQTVEHILPSELRK